MKTVATNPIETPSQSDAIENDTIDDQPMRLIDPTRYTWFYFKAPRTQDEKLTQTGLDIHFTKMVKQFQQQFFPNREPRPFNIQSSEATEFDTRQIDLLERQPSGSWSVELELRQTLDVYVLMVNVEASGEFTPQDLPDFPTLPFDRESVDHFLGAFTIYQAETNGDATTAASILDQQYLGPNNTSASIDTGYASLTVCDTNPDTVVLGGSLAYAQQSPVEVNEELTRIEKLVLEDMPLLGLCHFKAVNSRRRLRENCARLRSADRHLETLLEGRFEKAGLTTETKFDIERKLKRKRVSDLTLTELTEVSDELTNRRSELTDHAEKTRRELQSVDINRSNIKNLIQGWPDAAKLQAFVFDDVVRDAVAQARSDREYAKSTLLRGEVFRDSLNASTTRREVRETRRVTMLMGVLAAISAAALIPIVAGSDVFDLWPLGLRIASVTIPPAIAGFIYWLFRG